MVFRQLSDKTHDRYFLLFNLLIFFMNYKGYLVEINLQWLIFHLYKDQITYISSRILSNYSLLSDIMLTLSIFTLAFSFFLLSDSYHSVILSFSCSLWSSIFRFLIYFIGGCLQSGIVFFEPPIRLSIIISLPSVLNFILDFIRGHTELYRIFFPITFCLTEVVLLAFIIFQLMPYCQS